MMDGIANGLLAYASAHLLATLVIVPLVFLALRMRVIEREMHAALLLVACLLVVVGPAIPLQANVADEAVATISSTSAIAQTPAADDVASPRRSATGDEGSGITVAPTLAALLLASWMAGIAWSLARLLIAHAGVRGIVAASRRSPALENAHRTLLPAGVEILVSTRFGPAAIGILRPRIILPHDMAIALPANALRAVLLHEASHHRRRDVLVLLVQRLVEAVFWWNPLVRLLGTASDAAREVACDIRAARAYGAPTEYAEALLDAIAHFVPHSSRADARALHAAASLSTLDRRIDAIIEEPRSPGWMDRAVLPGSAGALMLLCIGASLAAPGIAMQPAADPASAVAMPEPDDVLVHEDALLALHDRYSQAVLENHERYSQALERLTDSYTHESSALAEEPPDDGKDARLEQLNARYRRLFDDSESRFRDAAAQAEASFIATSNALAMRGDIERAEKNL